MSSSVETVGRNIGGLDFNPWETIRRLMASADVALFNTESYVGLRKWELFRNTEVSILSRIKLCHVFSDSRTELGAIFIDNSDNAFAKGHNTKFNKLGTGFFGYASHSLPIPTLSMENVTSILTGYRHGAAMSQSGDVFFWGLDLSCEFYSASKVTLVPQKINAKELMRGERASQIACSGNALSVITTTGKLLVWGRWLGPDSEIAWKQEVKMSVDPKSIVGGGWHFAVVTSGGLYTFGDGGSGQLGYEWDSKKDGYVSPKRVKFQEPVYSVACSQLATLVCLRPWTLYVFGDNTRGRLGVESTENCTYVPTKINLAEPITYVLASAHDCLLYAVTVSRNKVYRWGFDAAVVKPQAVQVSTTIEAFANRAIPVANETPNADSAPPLVSVPESDVPLLGNFNDDGQFSDVIIKLKDGDFKAHRIILHSRSEHFKRLLSDSWVEGQTRVVDMTNYDAKAYRAYLFYLYNGVVERLEPTKVIHLYSLADQYLDVKLKDHCFNHFKTILKVENVGELYREAEDHSCFDLLNECYTFATRNLIKLEEHIKSVNFEAYMKTLLSI